MFQGLIACPSHPTNCDCYPVYLSTDLPFAGSSSSSVDLPGGGLKPGSQFALFFTVWPDLFCLSPSLMAETSP